MKKQKEAEEKAKILAAQEKAEAARIDSDAQDEEITAKLAGNFTSYSFDVNREVTVSKKSMPSNQQVGQIKAMLLKQEQN